MTTIILPAMFISTASSRMGKLNYFFLWGIMLISHNCSLQHLVKCQRHNKRQTHLLNGSCNTTCKESRTRLLYVRGIIRSIVGQIFIVSNYYSVHEALYNHTRSRCLCIAHRARIPDNGIYQLLTMMGKIPSALKETYQFYKRLSCRKL